MCLLLVGTDCFCLRRLDAETLGGSPGSAFNQGIDPAAIVME